MATLHIVGAGLAGLAAAVEASRPPQRWSRIVLYEAAAHAGGRCRSFRDERLGCLIDNGNHLVLGANRATLAYVAEIGGSLQAMKPAAFPFVDIASGERWTVRANGPAALLGAIRSVPGGSGRSGVTRLARAGPACRVADLLDPAAPVFRRFWDPLVTAVLNTAPAQASGRLLRRCLVELLWAGAAGLVPHMAERGLSAALVDPALTTLARRGAAIRFRARLQQVTSADGRIVALAFADGERRLADGDAVILAVPGQAAARLLPGIAAAGEASPIVNIHYRLPGPIALAGDSPVLAIVGGTAQWLFARGDVLSVTISAARGLVNAPGDALAAAAWSDVRRAIGAPPAMPAWRVVKERRATPLQTPGWHRSRPPAAIGPRNLRLAGDWVASPLPATIESAIRSGRAAARALAAPPD